MSDLRCVILPDRGILRVAGDDRHDFLQGLISNDVGLLSPDRALYAALLTPQGKYLFDFLLYERDGEILIDAELGRLPALLQRLTMYRLRSRVALADATAAHAVIAAFGGDAVPALGLPDTPGAVRAEGAALLAVDPRLAQLGVRAVVPRDDVQAFLAAHGLTPAPFAAYDRHRLALGVPDGSRDLVIEKSILLESGFEELHGVSFTKGCFVGQELTARTKHRGLIKKRLVPVRVSGPLPEPGTPVTRGGRDAGEMRSGSGEDGLALLRLEQLTAKAAGASPLQAGDAVLSPVLPPWLSLTAET
jgi:folate-binding protein YgfZ